MHGYYTTVFERVKTFCSFLALCVHVYPCLSLSMHRSLTDSTVYGCVCVCACVSEWIMLREWNINERWCQWMYVCTLMWASTRESMPMRTLWNSTLRVSQHTHISYLSLSWMDRVCAVLCATYVNPVFNAYMSEWAHTNARTKCMYKTRRDENKVKKVALYRSTNERTDGKEWRKKRNKIGFQKHTNNEKSQQKSQHSLSLSIHLSVHSFVRWLALSHSLSLPRFILYPLTLSAARSLFGTPLKWSTHTYQTTT